MASPVETVASFVPDTLVRRLESAPHGGVVAERVPMVVWFADLVGFTALTEQLAGHGDQGPELATDILNATLGRVIDGVYTHGGDVLGFAGDSIVAGWSHDADGAEGAAVLAAAAAIAAHQAIEGTAEAVEYGLKLRIGMGAGNVLLGDIGGVDGEWRFIASGDPMVEMGEAQEAAEPGQTIVSATAWELLKERSNGRPIGDRRFRLMGIAGTTPRPSPPTTARDDATAALRAHLPESVLMRLDAGHERWLAELRTVTAMLVNFPEYRGESRDLALLQHAVAEVQKVIHEHDGSLIHVLVDEKGATMVAAFGLPPRAHEEDAVQAVHTALAVTDRLERLGLRHGVGLSTGRAFCGVYGTTRRREYTMIGSAVNLAARLMSRARNEVLVSDSTVHATRHRVDFADAGEAQLKGFAGDIPVFRPLWKRAASDRQLDAVHRSQHVNVIGRDDERRQLTAWLGALAHGKASGVVLVEGEAGIGKSTLLGELVEDARSFDVTVLFGAGEAVEASTPYHAWSVVFGELLGLLDLPDRDARQRTVEDRIAGLEGFADRGALLNAVLGFEISESPSTLGMAGPNRLEATVDLLVTLLSRAAAERPLLVVLDDTHWLDSSSWALVTAASRRVDPMLLVIAGRPMDERVAAYDELARRPRTWKITLEPLRPEEAAELAADRLGVDDLPPEVAALIETRSEGHPFFAEELAYTLRDAGRIEIVDGAVRIRDADAGIAIDLPETLQGVVTSRIDRLTPDEQLTVKVAAVIGRTFDLATLSAVHPMGAGQRAVRDQLATMAHLGIIESMDGPEAGDYRFKHVIIQEAAYDLLSHEQRRTLHRAVAEWFEVHGTPDPVSQEAILAHHWEQAGDVTKAIEHLERSGFDALPKGAAREAIEFHRRSIALDADSGGTIESVSDVRRSDWHVQMGQAHEALGNLVDAEREFYVGLELLGFRYPTSTIGRVGRLVWEVVKQLVHIVAPLLIRRTRTGKEAAVMARAARINALLGEVYYFTADALGFPLTNVTAINLGERSGHRVAAGVAYSSLAYLVGTARLSRLARRYFTLARQAEDAELAAGGDDWVEPSDLGPGHLIAAALAESTYHLTFDRWDVGLPIVDEGIARCRSVGDNYSAEIGLAIRGFGTYCTGRLTEAWGDFEELLRSSTLRENEEHQAWAVALGTPVLVALDRTDRATELARTAGTLIPGADPLTVPIIYASQALALLEGGRPNDAFTAAERALDAFDATPIFIYLAGYTAMLETLFALWEREPSPRTRQGKVIARRVKRALKLLRRFSIVLPFSRPRHALYAGRYAELQGHTGRARRRWARGLRIAERGGLRWDAGLLHLELGRTASPGSQRDRHLQASRTHLSQVGSARDLRRLDRLSSV